MPCPAVAVVSVVYNGDVCICSVQCALCMNYCNHYAGPCPALSTKCSAHRQINIALPHKIRIQSATQILIKIQKHECRHQDFQQTFQKQNFLFVFFDSICDPDWLGWCWVAFSKTGKSETCSSVYGFYQRCSV